jgi:hypothetical protein
MLMVADIKHDSFPQPPDPNIAIWRYMDLAKLIWLLQRRALYFSRLDKVGDPFEGHYTRALAMGKQEFIAALKGAAPEPKQGIFEQAFEQMLEGVRNFKTWSHVSCWHCSEFESSAMWRLYTSMNDSVCIRSTYARLADVLPSDVHLGIITYVNYDSDLMNIGNMLTYVMHKRLSYAHEREARAILWVPPHDNKWATESKDPLGAVGSIVPVSIETLIQEVYVSPHAAPPLLEVVTGLVRAAGLDVNVRQSDVFAPPASKI